MKKDNLKNIKTKTEYQNKNGIELISGRKKRSQVH